MALDTMWRTLQMPQRICILIIVLGCNLMSSAVEQRPFYNIAHMVNSIKEVDYYLERGANAIEADVTFSPNGTALYTFHGYPCDCFRHCTEREEFARYLGYIREITTPGNHNYKKDLVLLFLDLKLSQMPHSVKALAGQDLAASLIQNLFNESRGASKINVLLSVGHVFDYDFILGFINELESRKLTHLSDRVGWDVGMNDPLYVIEGMWKRVDVVKNIWQGDGRTNCLSPFYNLGRLTAALRRRDEKNLMRPKPYIDKVYHWTIDLSVNLRSSLRTGVDGIITNHPERLVNVLKETEFVNKFRLAKQEDDPWLRISSLTGETPSPLAPIMQPIGMRIIHGIGDMFTSFTKYLGDFVYLRTSSRHDLKGRSLGEDWEWIQLLANSVKNSYSKKTKNMGANWLSKVD